MMKQILRRYRVTIITAIIFCLLLAFLPEIRETAGNALLGQVRTILFVIPPIFVLLGLFDVWVPREKMTQHMGKGSGIRGVILAFFLGSATAGPLYGAFPVAAVLGKKGASFFNIMVFIGAWSTTKVPMFLFELKALGPAFAFTRLAMSILGILLMAQILIVLISKKGQEASLELLASKY